eukprot:scaffold68417_cov19-Tisochrysis_lutea.AAC.1
MDISHNCAPTTQGQDAQGASIENSSLLHCSSTLLSYFSCHSALFLPAALFHPAAAAISLYRAAITCTAAACMLECAGTAFASFPCWPGCHPQMHTWTTAPTLKEYYISGQARLPPANARMAHRSCPSDVIQPRHASLQVYENLHHSGSGSRAWPTAPALK